MTRRLSLGLAAASVATATAGYLILSHPEDPSVVTLQAAVDAVRDDPVAGVKALPGSVSTYYEPAPAGSTQLTGSLYLRTQDGRCAVSDVVISRGWLQDPNAGSFTVTDPDIRPACPGT